MIHDLETLVEVTTNTIQTSQFIHFQLRALCWRAVHLDLLLLIGISKVVYCTIITIITNKEDSLFVSWTSVLQRVK